jgi:predicted transcriptional regulator
MPTDCPDCCRALEEIERIAFHIEEMTSMYLSRSEGSMTRENLAEREKLVSEHRKAVENAVNEIVRMSREARDVECQEV